MYGIRIRSTWEIAAGHIEAGVSAATAVMHACHGDWWPADQVEVRASLKGMHTALGDAEFEAAWQAGKKMNLEQALELEASGK